MGRFGSWLLVILACLGALAGLAFLKYSQIQAAIAFGESFPEPVEAVEAIVARQALWQPATQVTGEVIARRSVTLRAEAEGLITAVNAASGAQVERGDLLLELDLSEERAQRAAANAALRIAELDLARARKLISTGATTEDTRDRALANRDAAQAEVRRIEAIIRRKQIRAPFDAIAGLHVWEPGQYLEKGTEVLDLVGLDETLWVDFRLPQEQARQLSADRVRVLTGNDSPSVSAKLIAADAQVDSSSRNRRYRAEIARSELNAVPGELLKLEVPLGNQLDVTLVPATAVRRDNFGARVFVIVDAGEAAGAKERVQVRSVELGGQLGAELVITTGVAPGERLAATGAFKLRDGVLVESRPYQDPSPDA
ncbi:MAG: efflux RND transporter periplasmic adaptor subunit [Pseudomonadota bacterium]